MLLSAGFPAGEDPVAEETHAGERVTRVQKPTGTFVILFKCNQKG